MNFHQTVIVGVLCVCRIYAHEDAKEKSAKTMTHNIGRQSLLTDRSDALEEVVAKLASSVTFLGEKLVSMERKFETRFRNLDEAIFKEKTSIENISSRLDILDHLSDKVKQLDSSLEEETTAMQSTLSLTNKDVQRLSTQLEELERRTSHQRLSDVKIQQKKQAGSEKPAREAASSERVRLTLDDRDKAIASLVLEKMERTLPRLVATQLNHFYLNLATKVDTTMTQLERELVMRLRRIEATSKKSLSEIQDGRQDLSHLSHLQRTLISKQLNAKDLTGRFSSGVKCEEELRADLTKLLQQVHENVSRSFTTAVKNNHNHSFRSEDRQHRDKGGVPQTSEIWRGVFSSGLSRHPTIPVTTPGSKHCLDSTAFATLEEVKQLLRSLMTKGEDLKRTLTKQAGEGVDLLKLLHQRFSVLLRRMNTDPGHGEALLAEVQELEHLVENSYSSILLAQNVFIESCRRVQAEAPSIEGQIADILNKLVTNIDLGHQFNRKQLKDLRKLIEKMRVDGHSKLPILPPWMESNETDYNSYHTNVSSTPYSDRLFYQTVLLSAAEANTTEEKLQEVVERIGDVESELQSINWGTEDVKNIIDELLTGAKDLKGYSRSQIETLQNFRADMLEFSDSLDYQVSQTTSDRGDNLKKKDKSGEPDTLEGERHQKNLDSCFSSVVKEINTPSLNKYINNLPKNLTNSELMVKILQFIMNKLPFNDEPEEGSSRPTPAGANNTASTQSDSDFEEESYLQNVDQLYYSDLDREEMLMDDDLSWTKISYYDDEKDYHGDGQGKKAPSSSHLSTLSSKFKKKNKATVVEDNFRGN